MSCTFVFAQEMCRPSSEHFSLCALKDPGDVSKITFKGCNVIRIV